MSSLISAHFSQSGENLSRFSTTYPVIGDPPSASGLVHSRSTNSLSKSFMVGVPGFVGTSNGFFAIMACAVVSGSEVP